MTNPLMTQCLHRFCNTCICRSIESSVSDYCRCPLCNEKITKRSLRQQLELEDIINSIKTCVQLFEKDNNLSTIMSSDDRIIFDNSTTDESITFDNSICHKDKGEDNAQKINGFKDNDIVVEKKEKSSKLTTTITSVSDDCWPTCEDSFGSNHLTTNETKDMTDIEIITNINNTSIVSNECSIGEKSIQRLSKLETDESTEIINDLQLENESNDQLNGEKSKSVLTQSQNLLVSKSRITYSTRKASDDKFDQIISCVNNNYINPKVSESDDKLTESKDENGVKPIVNQSISDSAKKSKVKRNISYDCEYISDDTDEDDCFDSKPQNRKPLAQLKRLQNNETKVVNKKFKRVQRFDSSDEDIDSPIIIERKRKVQRIRESEPLENDLNESSKEIEIPESDMSDEELPSIYSNKNESIEVSLRIYSLNTL